MSEEEIQQEEVTEVTETTETAELDGEQAEQQEEAAASDGDDSTAEPKKKGVQKRIDELVRQREDKAREAEYWRQQALQKAPERPETPTQPTGKPTVESYDSYEEYLDALSDWKVDQRLKQQQEQAAQTQREQSLEQKQAQFHQKAAAFEAEDFQEIAFNPTLPISDAMRDVILDSDKGPELLYHLGKNSGEAARIATLNPVQAARELGLLEAKLSLPKAKTKSSAPPPIPPIGGGGEPPTADPMKLTPDEWAAQRNRELREKGRL